jgi:hypothetical protein
MSMLFLASFTVIFMVMLPLHWMRSTTAKVKPSYNSVSLHELRTNVYDKNDHLFAVQPAGRHLNATVAVISLLSPFNLSQHSFQYQ